MPKATPERPCYILPHPILSSLSPYPLSLSSPTSSLVQQLGRAQAATEHCNPAGAAAIEQVRSSGPRDDVGRRRRMPRRFGSPSRTSPPVHLHPRRLAVLAEEDGGARAAREGEEVGKCGAGVVAKHGGAVGGDWRRSAWLALGYRRIVAGQGGGVEGRRSRREPPVATAAAMSRCALLQLAAVPSELAPRTSSPPELALPTTPLLPARSRGTAAAARSLTAPAAAALPLRLRVFA